MFVLVACPRPEEPPSSCERVEVVPGGTTSSVWDDGTVSVSVLLEVTGAVDAPDWRTGSIDPSEGTVRTLSAPALASAGGRTAWVRALIDLSAPADGRAITLDLRGSYLTGRDVCDFVASVDIRPAPVRQDPLVAVDVAPLKRTLLDAAWPPAPPDHGELMEPEEDLGLPVALGPDRELLAHLSVPWDLGFVPPISPGEPVLPDPQPEASSVIFTHLDQPNPSWIGDPPDPTVAASTVGDVVMIGANTTVGWSDDGGTTFHMVDLFTPPDPSNPERTTFFPQDDGGICCDFVLAYVPRRDLFLWLSQTWPGAAGTNRLRLAWATSDGVRSNFADAWTWIDVDSAMVGIGNDWMDYPDLTVTDDYVYLSADHAIHGTGSVWLDRRIFTRWSLADLADPAVPYVGGATIDVAGPMLVKSHFARGSADAAWWAAVQNTSTLGVYRWDDATGAITSTSVGMSSFDNTDYASLAPDGLDWSLAPKGVLGAAYAAREDVLEAPTVYFAFSAGRNAAAARPQPYVRIEALNSDTLQLVDEVDVWNDGYAFSTPSLSPRCHYTCDVALAVSVGGGGSFGEHSVGFLYDWVVYVTGSSDSTGDRWGDYNSVVPSVGPDGPEGRGEGFSSLGYDLVGGAAHLNYVQFGRDHVLVLP